MTQRPRPRAASGKAPSKAPRTATASRLDAEAWITRAIETLAKGGVEAVRVEPLAKALSVTKGSFYWHFANRRALLDAVLSQWAQGRIAAIRRQTIGNDTPRAILARLADLYTRHASIRGLAIELAIRDFARGDARAAVAVRAVDHERLIHVTRLFEGLGWGAAEARARAVMFYSYLFGQSLLDTKVATAATKDIAIETILASP